MAEISQFEGDLFWNDDDTEATCEPEEELYNLCDGDIVEFQQAKRLANFFGALISGEPRFFDTLEETEAAMEDNADGLGI